MPYSHLTPQEAGAILAAHLPEPPTELPSVSLVGSTDADPAAGASFQAYLVHTTPHTTTYFLTLQFSEPLIGEAPLTTPNSIRAQYNLLAALSHTHILHTAPHPTAVSRCPSLSTSMFHDHTSSRGFQRLSLHPSN